ncbi:tudor domain-containing protein 3-like [Nannochloropsis oceanica]
MELADLLQTDIRKLEGDRIPLPKMDDVTGTIGGPFILQIVSVIDGTKPSSKQHIGDGGQERVLLLRVTDGTSSKFTAIEMVRLPKLSTDTPPGTKLLVSDVRYVKHKLLLQPCSVLGVEGVVEALANNFRSSRLLEQQYKLSKDLQVKKKNAAGEGPPAFDAFKPDASKSAAKGGADRTIIVAAVVVIRREVVVPAEAGAALEEMALLLSPTVVQTMTVAVARWILFLLLLRIGEEGEGKEEVDIAVEAVLVAALGAGVVVEDNRAIEDGGEEEEEEEEGEDEVVGMALRTPPLLRLSQAFIPWKPISR